MREEKRKMIEHLQRDVHARLFESDLGGVGVRALQHIPRYTSIFDINQRRGVDSRDVQIADVKLSYEELRRLPGAVGKYIRDMIKPENGLYTLPQHGLNALDPSYFVNATTVGLQASVWVFEIASRNFCKKAPFWRLGFIFWIFLNPPRLVYPTTST